MPSLRTIALAAAVCGTVFVIACGEHSSPTAPTNAAQIAVSPDPVKATGQGGNQPASYPPPSMKGPSVIGFPPRNEPDAFFRALIDLYRERLGRTQSSPTYVDPEGENVWLTEYFRFYLNGCSHQEAMSRTLAEITTGGTQQVCGQETPVFPPRDLPNAFQGELERTYSGVLGRPLMLSYVDSEGANVWLAQYLRFRLSGCGHAVAQTKVFTEILGGGVQPPCFDGTWTGTTSQNWPISFSISNGALVSLNYKVNASGSFCTVTMTSTFTGLNELLTGNSFSFNRTTTQQRISLVGQFNSGTAASGSAQWSFLLSSCPASTNFTWNATKTSAGATEIDATQGTHYTIERR
jgi:hypothetical protein